MKIHFISNINGLYNEGMRNVASHLGKRFEQAGHDVIYSRLKDIPRIPGRCAGAELTLIFARAEEKTYRLARMAEKSGKRLCFVIVQPPRAGFIKLNDRRPLVCDYLTLCAEDCRGIKLSPGKAFFRLNVGVDTEKFSPVCPEEKARLKKKYGLDPTAVTVVHVGHASVGRGLSDFLLDGMERFQRLVVISGMFDDPQLIRRLRDGGVKVLSGYIENIEEIYRLSDAYFFTVRDGDYVISSPLSVLEALSCGVPVVAYAEFAKLKNISLTNPDAITYADEGSPAAAIEKAVECKGGQSFLSDAKSWEEAADAALEGLYGRSI